MRIGVFGGSFDPIHIGHLILAEQCRERAQLDEVWFIPSATAPHKPQGATGSDRQRWEMLQLAIAGHPQFRANDCELKRGGTSYTVETLTSFRAQFPQHTWFLMLGGDSLTQLPTWRDPRQIVELAELLVVARPGQALDWDPVAAWVTPERAAQWAEWAQVSRQIDISSSELRRRIQTGLSIRYLVPRAIEKFIETHSLYR